MTSPAQAHAVGLSDHERARYASDGYFVRSGVLDETELARLRTAASAMLELALNSCVLLGRRNPRLDARLLEDGRVLVRKMQPVNDLAPEIGDLSADERLVGPMSELMGDEPVLMEEKLNFKQLVDLRGVTIDLERSDRRRTVDEAWLLHHDWGYYRYNGYPPTTMSSAIALDDCEGRGPLRVIPGSHLVEVELADPGSGSGVLAPGALGAASGLVPLNLEAGSVAFFDSKLVHDSEPNLSGKPRRLMVYSHYPSSHDPREDPDRRNRPTRQMAQAMEAEYRRQVEAGARPPIRLDGAHPSAS